MTRLTLLYSTIVKWWIHSKYRAVGYEVWNWKRNMCLEVIVWILFFDCLYTLTRVTRLDRVVSMDPVQNSTLWAGGFGDRFELWLSNKDAMSADYTDGMQDRLNFLQIMQDFFPFKTPAFRGKIEYYLLFVRLLLCLN